MRDETLRLGMELEWNWNGTIERISNSYALVGTATLDSIYL